MLSPKDKSRSRDNPHSSPKSKRSPLRKFKRNKMYNHVLVRLKTQVHQKLHEQRRVRTAVEEQLKPYMSEKGPIRPQTDDFNPVVSTHHFFTFALTLQQPITTLTELPQDFVESIKTIPDIEAFSPAVIVQNPEDAEKQPTPQQAIDVFAKWAPSLNLDKYEVWGIKTQAARAEDAGAQRKPESFGLELRDKMVEYMKENHSTVLFDRSPEIKAKLNILRAQAQLEAKQNNTAYKKPELNQVLVQMEMSTKVGFWYTESEEGSAAKPTPAAVLKKQQNSWNDLPMEEKVGQPVVICKIGEIYLKKGNRQKFINQLHSNVSFKLGTKATVKSLQYAFVIQPPASHKGRPFTAAEVKEVVDIVKCIAGVDSLHVAMKTKPTQEAMVTTMQYVVGTIALENESCKTKPLVKASILDARPEYRDAMIQYLKGAALPVEQQTEEQQAMLKAHKAVDANAARVKRRLHRLNQRMEDIFNLGSKVDASLTQPCAFQSRSELARNLGKLLITETTKLAGLEGGRSFLDPGRYQKYLRELKRQAPPDPYASDDDCSATFDDDEEVVAIATPQSATASEEKIVEGKSTTMNDDDAATTTTTTTDTMSDKPADATTTTAPTKTTHKASATVYDDAPSSMWVKPTSGLEFMVDVTPNDAYIYLKSDSQFTVGGQPIGTGQDTNTVVCLLSGGMDSPVAAFSLMKRGMRVILVHFQNANLADEETVQNKIIQLSDHLSKYQMQTYLHIVPFSAIQDAIITEVPSPARMLVYRRFMMHISAKIAEQYNAAFLVVGDALGQVASQTPKNMSASYADVPLPLLSPLVGSNKSEIMDIARKIGTYAISALPYGDCCSYFLAKHPLTSIEKPILQQYERNVGRALGENGNEQLIVEAQNASAVYRWYKPADGMQTLRSMQPVQSHHDNAATSMLMSCPVNLGKDAEEEDDEMTDATTTTTTTTAKKDKKRERQEDDAEEAEVLKQQVVEKKQRENVAKDEDNTVVDINKEGTVYSNNMVAYLDSASTTRVLPTVMNAVQRFTTGQLFGNASSLHVIGKTADLAVKQATTTLLGIINAHPRTEEQQMNVYGIGGDERLIYTSGGTEANNLAIFGSLKHLVQKQVDAVVTSLGHVPVGQKLAANQQHPTNLGATHTKKYVFAIHLITSSLEHSAILEPLELVKQSPDNLLNNRYGLNISFNVVITRAKNDNHGLVQGEGLKNLIESLPHVKNTTEIAIQTGLDAKADDVEVIDIATFCSIMHGNNEIGTLQPLDKIGAAIQQAKATNPTANILFHTDACQSFGKVNVDVQHCGVDLLTLNGHKLHGLKGVGALYIRPNVKVAPLVHGGRHQHNIRSGTLNVAGIVSMQHAATYCYSIPANIEADGVQDYIKKVYQRTAADSTTHDLLTQHGKEIRQKQLKFMWDLKQLFPRAVIHGPNAALSAKYLTLVSGEDSAALAERSAELLEKINDLDSELYNAATLPSLPSVLSILFDPSSQLDSPGIVKYLSTRGVCVSAGSACASNNSEPKPSHVLAGIGLPDQWSNGTVRLSFSVLTSQKELDNALEVFKQLAHDLHTLYAKKKQ